MKKCTNCGAVLSDRAASVCPECGNTTLPADDGYDGYYDDVLPPDADRVQEGVDKELIKKIIALAIGAIFIISMCVVMLYVL